MDIDKENGNHLWEDSTLKEMNGVKVAFDIKNKYEKPPPGYNFVELMLIFYVKIDFTRKSRMVARGNQTAPPTSVTYSSVVSRESVRIAFLVAALNDLDVSIFDIGNAYHIWV